MIDCNGVMIPALMSPRRREIKSRVNVIVRISSFSHDADEISTSADIPWYPLQINQATGASHQKGRRALDVRVMSNEGTRSARTMPASGPRERRSRSRDEPLNDYTARRRGIKASVY